MIRRMILRRLDAEERVLGGSMDYARYVARTSLGAFVRFALFTPLSRYRRKVPADAYFVAGIVATRDEDCGTCVQIQVNLARRAGVPAEIVRAVLASRPEDLPGELADVYRFARSVVEATGDDDEHRERVRARYGEEALVELALGMAAARVYPVVKRSLGYAKSCALVSVEV